MAMTTERPEGDVPRSRAARGGGPPVPVAVPAGLPRRAAALAIDYALAAASCAGLATVIEAIGLRGQSLQTAWALSSAALIVLYFTLLEGAPRGATVGKRVLGLRVTDDRGERLRYSRALGRTLAKLLSLVPFGIGFLMAAFSDRHKALHDLLAGTLVQRAA